ncbi:MAG TPA: thioredoxin family protein [Candidatus Aminicenantes bacterium]|nr:thioredoxin family protein [Candidatus Aminicenantes bacterium]
MLIQILGTGCAKCQKLEENATQAATELHLEFRVEKVKELSQIMAFGVMITPALAVDGQVKLAGKVPSVEDLKKMLAP